MKISRGFVLMFVAAAACGGGGSGDDGDDVIVDEPDAEVSDEPDANEAPACLVEASYGNATLANQTALKGCGQGDVPCADANDPDAVLGNAELNAVAPLDVIGFEFYKGFSVFNDQIVPGTYQLAGEELNYATCAVCIRIFSDVADDGSTTQQFFPTGGSVTITQIEPNLQVELNDVTFVEVTIADDFTSTPVPGGCSTSITSATFDAPAPDVGAGA